MINMGKIAFVGFGEVNTPVDVIVRNARQQPRHSKARDLTFSRFSP